MRLIFTMTFSSLAFCLLASGSASAQPKSEPFVVESGSSGEETSREIDAMAVDAKKNGERLFVVVRLGTGETSRRLNLGRLYNTRTYIANKSFNSQTTVFSEGERVKGEGQIEFYLGSHLRLVVLAKRNRMPNLTCCEDYFPVKRRSNRGSKTRRLNRS